MRKQAFTIAALVLCAQAALASSPDLNVQLNLLESKVTGKAQPNLSLAERVADLEKVVHGQVRSGSLVKRVKDLADVTGGSTVQNFKPPELPKVDTSASTAEHDTPPAKAVVSHPVTPRTVASSSRSRASTATTKAHKPTDISTGETAAQSTLKARIENDIRLGMQHHNSGNLVAAKAAFRRALRFDPKNVNAHFNMGVICEETGDLPRALAHYQAAAEHAPKDAEIQDAVLSLQKKLGNTAGAASSRPQYGSNAQPYSDQQSSTATASAFTYEQQVEQDSILPTPAPDFRQSGSYQSGPFYAGNPANSGTPLLQGQAQQADLAGGAHQNNLGINGAPISGIGTVQQHNLPPLSASAGSFNSGAAQNSHPGRRKFLQSAATAVGLGAISIGSGLVRSRTGFGGGGLGVLHCPVCSWLNRF